MSAKPCAPAAERNSGPILDVLRDVLTEPASVLEIGSGTGQHAIRFGAELPHLSWQTSDLEENHAGIRAWLDEANLPNVRPPIVVDVLAAQLPPASYDAVYSANTTHVMSIDAVARMFELVGSVLRAGGPFCLYGPFRQNGEFNAASNAQFDAKLRGQDPEMGIRDFEDLERLAAVNGLRRRQLFAMPSNNYLVVWEKEGEDTA